MKKALTGHALDMRQKLHVVSTEKLLRFVLSTNSIAFGVHCLHVIRWFPPAAGGHSGQLPTPRWCWYACSAP